MQLLAAVVFFGASFLSTAATESLKSTLSSHPSLSILHDLLKQFNLLESFDSFSNITLIAPTDDAYRALAKWGFNVSEVEPFIARALLTYHVLDGTYTADSIPSSNEKQVVHSFLQPPILTNVTQGAAVKLSRNGGTGMVVESGLQVIGGVDEADIRFDDGIIHTLNSSMVLPHNISTTAQLGNLSEFLEAMDVADSVTLLESLKDVTVFIPHNLAFERLNPLLGLLRPSQLASILEYHAVPGKVLYHESMAESESTLQTVQGSSVHIHTDESGETYVNQARIVRQDLIIYGGVAHIIDDVLIPKLKEPSEYLDPLGSSFRMQKTPWTPQILW
ncbi:Fasciclin-domain-containing protein [Viridothelium virens]|uniref:Fasciclin-domain-containing protein n=1 Tax=Viridothelium virens TaxID=1048519 RepID=A0A6A6GXU3_VIRVR|nr:Fasciclin-domain-containing protein [Viridothelium virens]